MVTSPERTVRLLPLGGLGEIGMNCLALEMGPDILVVDCGIAFPHDDLGLDVLHPNFSWLFERSDRVRAVFLTHGHEDHVGALPYFLREVNVPVYGPPHALGVARRRLAEHGFGPSDVELRPVIPGDAHAIGGYRVEPIRVAHSIVEASALCIETPVGTIVHTGDFNFDPAPPDGEPTDERRLAELGDRGVDLLLSDSTNIDVDKKSHGEVEVGEALEQVVRAAAGRVFIALFSSNIQRLILLGEIARRTGRKVCTLGRSLRTQVEVATEIGRLRWPSDLLVPPELAASMPRDSLLILAGGTQGETNSAMARLAAGTHQDLRIDEGDTVVLSSRIIPGNERPVFSMMANVLRRGAILRTRVTDPAIHTSGHATRAEQRKMIELVRPRCFLPVHGTLYHLRRHAELAGEAGVAHRLVVENGTSVVFDGDDVYPGEPFVSGVVSIGFGGKPVSEDVLRQRLEVARTGTVTVSLALDRSGRVVAGPDITARGVEGVSASSRPVRALTQEIVRILDRARRRRVPRDQLQEDVRRLVRRSLEQFAGTRPAVDVVFLDYHG